MICFNPRALTSPDKDPDAETPPPSGFNPRALTSPDAGIFGNKGQLYVSIRGLLRALTTEICMRKKPRRFQSAGSYEPWQTSGAVDDPLASFNPRALTSPDGLYDLKTVNHQVSIRGLLRALTSLPSRSQQRTQVSIRGLLRALTAISNKLFAKNCRIFYIIHNSNHNRK